jgi:excisionase family DNA binding protein
MLLLAIEFCPVDDRFLIGVQEAAARLGVTPDAVRKRIAAGHLSAQRRGREWWLDARLIDRVARQRAGQGRPLSLRMAWGVLLLASGDDAAAARAVRNARYRSRLRAWLRSHSLAEHSGRLRTRAEVEEFDAHPSELARILDRPDVLRTGISAAEVVGLVGGGSAVELYAPAGRREAIIDEHVLEPGPGPVRIRWVPDEIWPLLDEHRDGRAPRAAVLLDLLEHDDPRARREAAQALER